MIFLIIYLLLILQVFSKSKYMVLSNILTIIVLILSLMYHLYLTLAVLILQILGYVIIGNKRYYTLKVKEIYLKSEKITKNYEAIFISDFQFDKNAKSINELALKNVINKVNAFEKDMIFLGGDFINYSENIDRFFDIFSELDIPKMGIYSITGNHDYVDLDKVLMKLNAQGIVTLMNQKVQINDEITIVGVEDSWYGKPALIKTNPYVLNILLAHNPNFIKKINDKNNIDMMLSGHFHNGQFNLLPNPFIRFISKYIYGTFKEKNLLLYVTSGLGGSLFRGRFIGVFTRYNADPEIVKITLVSTKE